MSVIIAFIINDIVLLIILSIISVKRLGNQFLTRFIVIFIIIVTILILDVCWLFFLYRMNSCFIFVESNQWTCKEVLRLNNYFIPGWLLWLGYYRYVIASIVANAEWQVVTGLVLNYRLSKRLYLLTLGLESPWYTEGSRIVKLLGYLVALCFISVWMSGYVVRILISF